MTDVAKLDLVYLPMEDQAFADDPYPHFRAARERHPWLASCAAGYVVHSHAAMQDLLWMDDRMRGANEMIVERMGADGTHWGRFQRENMLSLSGASHQRFREIVQPMFTPRQANQNRQLMKETICRLLDEWAPRGGFDFEEFASHFPISVMCAMIGAPLEEIPRLRSSLEAFGLSFSLDPDYLPALEEAMIVLDDFVQQLVADRRAGVRPGDKPDLLDTLMESCADDRITERQLYDLLIFLFVAGYDTSKNVLTLIMHALLDRPEIYALCGEDLSYCTKVVEETLRYTNTATIPRLTTEDISYREVLIPRGTMLFFPVSVGGRDPESFPEPEKFDPGRVHENRHMAFGRGAHLCLGQFIARAQIEEGLHQIAQRIKHPRLVGPVGHRPFPGTWGLRGLPIEFDS